MSIKINFSNPCAPRCAAPRFLERIHCNKQKTSVKQVKAIVSGTTTRDGAIGQHASTQRNGSLGQTAERKRVKKTPHLEWGAWYDNISAIASNTNDYSSSLLYGK